MSRAVKYNVTWNTNDLAKIEMACIRLGGKWKDKAGSECGEGLFHHYKELQTLLWPQKKWHRWNELLLRSFIENRMVGILGPASSGKTKEAADWALTNYLVWPKETTVLISSTDVRSLELRVWGEIKKQFQSAKERYPWLPGHAIGSKLMITTSDKFAESRDFRNGVVGIPCLVGGHFVGLGRYIGIKNHRLIQVADECQFMSSSFLDATANLSKNPIYQILGLGNPLDRDNPLAKLCEPSDELGGWDGLGESEKTRTWPTRFDGGIAIQLIGTDSPNFDVPADQPPPFPFLINRKHIENDLKYYGRDSLQFTMMNLGTLPRESVSRRVITRMLCQQFGAMESVVWTGDKIVKILGLDAAYGAVGGDRCVLTEVHVGVEVGGKQVVAFAQKPVLVPIVGGGGPPEDQIARFVMDYATQRGIPASNIFYDSTGRGTLGSAFARVGGVLVNPVEFGGKPTERPVGGDVKATAREYYSKRVSELWYQMRRIIEAGQMRQLPQEVMEEGCLREWKMVSGNRIEVESKDETKKRMGKSPDLMDSAVVAVEGAFQRGFSIGLLGASRLEANRKWIDELIQKRKQLNKRNVLAYA